MLYGSTIGMSLPEIRRLKGENCLEYDDLEPFVLEPPENPAIEQTIRALIDLRSEAVMEKNTTISILNQRRN